MRAITGALLIVAASICFLGATLSRGPYPDPVAMVGFGVAVILFCAGLHHTVTGLACDRGPSQGR